METRPAGGMECSADGSCSIWSRLLKLLVCIIIVVVFIFVVGPAVSSLPLVKPLTTFINERGIDARALFYTEIDECSDAEVYMRTRLRYSAESKP